MDSIRNPIDFIGLVFPMDNLGLMSLRRLLLLLFVSSTGKQVGQRRFNSLIVGK